jgi:hypothetical protein
MAQVITQVITAPFSCRFTALPGIACEGEFCAFDFPCCEGCPKSKVGKATVPEDPLKSPIWRGWINGMAGINK